MNPDNLFQSLALMLGSEQYRLLREEWKADFALREQRKREKAKLQISQAYPFRGLMSKMDTPLKKGEKEQCQNAITQARAIRRLKKLLKQQGKTQSSRTSGKNQRSSSS